jgi:hypothetical protein
MAINPEHVLVRLVCKRGDDLFGLAIYAANKRHAVSKARKLLEGSGYSVYPMGEPQ